MYGEANHEDTAIIKTELVPGKLVVDAVNGNTQKLSTLNTVSRAIPFVDKSNLPNIFELDRLNSFVCTDDNSNLVLVQQVTLPEVAPLGRLILNTAKGSVTPDGSIGKSEIMLKANYWYEIEVLGAGGGGGAGAISDYTTKVSTVNLDGAPGGSGGYFKGLFSITQDTLAILEAGCPGGRGLGHYINKVGGSIILSSNTMGGDGGRSPISFPDTGGNGGQAKWGVTGNRLGGSGINDGGYGGGVLGNLGLPAESEVGSAGGGANGSYGGYGGSCIYEPPVGNNYTTGPGAGGGAGGGLGVGGDGGIAITADSEVIKYSGIGYGGGSGGRGSIHKDGLNTIDYQYSAGAGGGGGASRFRCGDIDVICGGGGGGASCGRGPLQTGAPGYNNQDANVGGGALPGAGGIARGKPDMLNNQSYETHGFFGSPGVVRLWRCVE